MSKDTLLLLEPGFTDPAYPGERFICPDCNPIEGLLAACLLYTSPSPRDS